MGRQHVNDGARQGAPQTFLAQAKKHPIAFLVTRDHARFDHELEVAADTGLALAEDLGELTDVEFAVGQDKKDANAGRFGDCPQSYKQFVHAKSPLEIHINISLYAFQ